MSPGQTGHITGQMGRVPGTDGTHTRGCPAKILYVYWFSFLSHLRVPVRGTEICQNLKKFVRNDRFSNFNKFFTNFSPPDWNPQKQSLGQILDKFGVRGVFWKGKEGSQPKPRGPKDWKKIKNSLLDWNFQPNGPAEVQREFCARFLGWILEGDLLEVKFPRVNFSGGLFAGEEKESKNTTQEFGSKIRASKIRFLSVVSPHLPGEILRAVLVSFSQF